MRISVINLSNGKVRDEELLRVIRAINRQIRDDFTPYWNINATLTLEGHSGSHPGDSHSLPMMRGDAVLYLWDNLDVSGAVAYHDLNDLGIPAAYVFINLCEDIGEPWTVAMSHEVLEMIADPAVNLLVEGPHPAEQKRTVFHWFEICDAVQKEQYAIDGVAVCNFLLPLYFTTSEEKGSRNDFLGRTYNGKALASFGVNPGGYIGFFDPKLGKSITWYAHDDTEAAQRIAKKRKAKKTRRSVKRLRK